MSIVYYSKIKRTKEAGCRYKLPAKVFYGDGIRKSRDLAKRLSDTKLTTLSANITDPKLINQYLEKSITPTDLIFDLACKLLGPYKIASYSISNNGGHCSGNPANGCCLYDGGVAIRIDLYDEHGKLPQLVLIMNYMLHSSRVITSISGAIRTSGIGKPQFLFDSPAPSLHYLQELLYGYKVIFDPATGKFAHKDKLTPADKKFIPLPKPRTIVPDAAYVTSPVPEKPKPKTIPSGKTTKKSSVKKKKTTARTRKKTTSTKVAKARTYAVTYMTLAEAIKRTKGKPILSTKVRSAKAARKMIVNKRKAARAKR